MGNLVSTNFASDNECPVSKIVDIIAPRGMIANPHKQQIPPLRCASVGMTTKKAKQQVGMTTKKAKQQVGMTNDVNNFRDRIKRR
jgi:hypothetical protein